MAAFASTGNCIGYGSDLELDIGPPRRVLIGLTTTPVR